MNKRVLCLLLSALMLFGAAAFSESVDTSGVAEASDMTDVIDIVDESMKPVAADRLVDGVYAVEVDVSSSMFKVVGCELTVANGEMTAKLAMKSDAYSYMFPGTAEEAARADAAELVALETGVDGGFSFTLPVDALDAAYTCAAFSARKQLWYPRTLVFRSDSLPLDAWNPAAFATAEALNLADGAYTCEVSLDGTGRAALVSPAAISVEGGACTAEIEFTTRKIDYVIVGGEKYAPVRVGDGAAFAVPVAAFDLPLSIIVDSTAIKPSVEVAYTVTFDSATIRAQ